MQLNVEVRPDTSGNSQSSPTSEQTVAFVRELILRSAWYPEHPLDESVVAALIDAAKEISNQKEGLRHEEALAIAERILGPGARVGNTLFLATNTLVLLSQMKDGNPLSSLSASRVMPLHDGIEECWGMITVQRSRVDLRVRSEDVDRLEEATERALVALNIHASNSRQKKVAADTGSFLLCTMENHPAREISKDGTESRSGKIHVLSRWGRGAYIVSRPLQLSLTIAVFALLLTTVVMQSLEVALSLTGWFAWWHSLIDKLLTTALWAAVLAYAAGIGEVRRHPHIRTGGKRVLIGWKR
ncbi:hypothetical protein [Microbacterium sp. SS28]|uniref:hypothetical protein n=1 Tax=Microbacterium sp. SS28 TaxID=2919948 RepID=UPI001FAAEB57|nr:hypothetical protein [Microbacterium sp. SS28]